MVVINIIFNMENQHKDEIMRAIGNLEGKVKTGFEGIHDRQDTTNGRLGKTEDRVGDLEKADIDLTNKIKSNTDTTRGSEKIKAIWLDRLLVFGLYIIGTLFFYVLLKTQIVNL